MTMESRELTVLSISATVVCPECEGTGKGPARYNDVDGNNNFQRSDSCERCLGRKQVPAALSLARLAALLREAADGA